MTEWISASSTRHIPEDELHAYLDQALSRSQCVEIECHLADCRRCATERDRAAAIRDRITALLAEAAPAGTHTAPPFEELLARHHARRASRAAEWARLGRAAGLAAGVLIAVGAGWLARGGLGFGAAPAARPGPEQGQPAERSLVAIGGVDTLEATLAREPAVSTGLAERAGPSEPLAVPADQPRVELVRALPGEPARLAVRVSSFDALDEGPGLRLPGLWQAVDWHEAWALTGGNLPRIDGLPVIDVQIQRSPDDGRPIVVVAQQHPSGRIVRTVEGPVERVASLIEGQLGERFNASAFSFTPPDYLGDDAGAARRGLRILTVTGGLPADSLNALAREITLR